MPRSDIAKAQRPPRSPDQIRGRWLIRARLISPPDWNRAGGPTGYKRDRPAVTSQGVFATDGRRLSAVTQKPSHRRTAGNELTGHHRGRTRAPARIPYMCVSKHALPLPGGKRGGLSGGAILLNLLGPHPRAGESARCHTERTLHEGAKLEFESLLTPSEVARMFRRGPRRRSRGGRRPGRLAQVPERSGRATAGFRGEDRGSVPCWLPGGAGCGPKGPELFRCPGGTSRLKPFP